MGVVAELAVTEPYVLELAATNVTELNNNVTKAVSEQGWIISRGLLVIQKLRLSSYICFLKCIKLHTI